MFGKLKQINELRKIQKKISSLETVVEEDGILVKVNGEMKILEIKISQENENIGLEELGEKVKKVLNKALDKVKIEMAKNINPFV